MDVYLAHYDVRNSGAGASVFVSEELATQEIIGWCRDRGLVGDEEGNDCITETQARESLELTGSVNFEAKDCYYSIEKQEVKTTAAQEAPGASVEGMVAVCTSHVRPESLEWLLGGAAGAIVYPNEYGGFMYVGDPQTHGAEGEKVPEEVKTIARWARQHGMAWVKFDPDGHVVPALETFEH